ncbi:MAG TPA: CCA tRNA nucleotidyltransferase, partial [Paracoccaceae bacterium]|nr:CCA tRNA nucleotidyltransferase [Paracoccaceae bacterium]
LAALGGSDAPSRLRLSRADARHLERLTEAAYSATPPAEIAYRHGAIVAKQAAVLRAALANVPLTSDDVARLDIAAQAQFPVAARDLMHLFEGAALGAELARLEARWIASGFALSRADLLNGG